MKVAFFHGLESNVNSEKSLYLKSNYDAWCPPMNYEDPNLFEETYQTILKDKPDLLIGSSMGGWFAYCISTLTGIPTLLLNPAVQGRSMEPKVHLGYQRAHHTIVLGKNDDVIDPSRTKKWFKTYGKGTHEFHMEPIGHRTPNPIMVKYLKDISINEDWSIESPGNAAIPVVAEMADEIRSNFMTFRPHPGTLTVEELRAVINYTKNRNPEDVRLALSVKESPVDEFYKWMTIRGQYIKRSEIEKIWANKVLIKLTDELKDHFKRPRPYWMTSDIVPLEGTEKSSWSYPSGHATGAYLIARELGKQYPHLLDGLMALANEISLSRVKTGVHFPSDIEGGKDLAYLISKKI